MKKRTMTLGMVLGVLVVAGMARAEPPPVGAGEAALETAARQQKYLFVLFCKQDDAVTQSMRQTLESALAGRPGPANMIQVQTTDPAEKPLVDRFGLSRTPMPLVLAVAPNGAITGGFPVKLTEKDVAAAFVSPTTAACLKAAPTIPPRRRSTRRSSSNRLRRRSRPSSPRPALSSARSRVRSRRSNSCRS